jgi:hypothetical protein
MEILNQLLSNQVEYLNALRHAQQMPTALSPDSGNDPKFRFNGKIIVRFLAAACIFYIGYQVYKITKTNPSDNED